MNWGSLLLNSQGLEDFFLLWHLDWLCSYVPLEGRKVLKLWYFGTLTRNEGDDDAQNPSSCCELFCTHLFVTCHMSIVTRHTCQHVLQKVISYLWCNLQCAHWPNISLPQLLKRNDNLSYSHLLATSPSVVAMMISPIIALLAPIRVCGDTGDRGL